MSTREAILDAIEAGADRVRDIAERTGIPRSQIWTRLTELRRADLVRVQRMKWNRRGGQEKRYEITYG